MASIHVDDVGTELVAVIVDESEQPVDLSAAVVRTIKLRKPGGVVLVKNAVNDTTGIDGKIKYVTVAGDLDSNGTWTIQGYVELAGGQKFNTDEATFRVKPNLS